MDAHPEIPVTKADFARPDEAARPEEAAPPPAEGPQVDQATQPAEGLRSRKKRQTHRAIECAALELFLERGYESVTIEDICERADVSRKTFFNYFPSKLSVATGGAQPLPGEEELIALFEQRSDENYLDVLVSVIEGTQPLNLDAYVKELRHEVFARMPAIFFQKHHHMTGAESAVVGALTSHLTAHPEARVYPDASVREEVIGVLSVAACIVQIRSSYDEANERSADAGDAARPPLETPSITQTRHMLARFLLSDA